MSEQRRSEPRRLIGRQAQETPPELRSRPGRARRFHPDLLKQASRRLEIVALIAAALWASASVLGHVALGFSEPGSPNWAIPVPPDGVALGGILVSLGLYFYLHSAPRDPERVMNLGLGYMVLTAFAIGVLMHWGAHVEVPSSTNPVISWIGPVLLMAAAIAPADPKRFAVAGFIAASMDPLGMVIARAIGLYHFEGLGSAILMHFPTYLLLGVAIVISVVVSRLGYQVSREREMGSYRLGELLGQGGMGQVYRATHRMLARPAAIKLIRPEVLAFGDGDSAQTAIARFRREAETAATLRSPHTVELYDFGVTEDQTLYFVMELLDGLDLETLVRRHGPVPPARAIHIISEACDSLAEAHCRGLVHRDIKPANIHIGRLGLRHDFVKVLDFGLVKSVGKKQNGDFDSLATAAGTMPGTPAYMAPEMALGEQVDGRADIYALGCVAYFLLTGRPVFDAELGFQAIARHLNVTPDPPSRHAGTAIPEELDRTILACLAKRPDDRPQTATQLQKLLRQVPGEPWTQEEAVRWWAAHRTPT
jgi:serine/threonine-protein kinase